LIIVAGLQLGLLGLFGWDVAAAVFAAYTKAAYIAMGISCGLAAFQAAIPLK
jgi:uncharacterized membrane protein YuzA (DUF378 family)